MSATRERTREVFGFKKENLENPNVILYQQESTKLKSDYKELFEVSKAWMDSLAKMRVEGELLSNAYSNFGQTSFHKEGENLSRVHNYLDSFNGDVKMLYENVEDNYFKTITDAYKFHLKNIDDHDAKTHRDKLAFEDATTNYNKPMYHETEQKSRDRFNRMTTTQSVFQADCVQYMQLMADLESKTELQVPQAFRLLMNDLEAFFERGRSHFAIIDVPDWKRSDSLDVNGKPNSGINLNKSSIAHHNNTTFDDESPLMMQKETIETTEISSGSNIQTTQTTTTTTAPISAAEKADLIGNPLN